MISINCNSSNKVLKSPKTKFNARFDPFGKGTTSTYSSPEVVLPFSLYESSTIHKASDQFLSCVYLFFADFAFHPSPQTKISRSKVCTRQIQTAVSSDPFKIGHVFIRTYLLGIIHTTTP
jgi:hypothetical protein